MILGFWLSVAVLRQDTLRLSLDDAARRAVRSFPGVAVARAQQERSGADLGVARSALLPHVRLDASLMRYQEPMIVFPLHSLNLANPPVFDRTLVQPGISAGYTLYDFGARRAQIDAASAREAAATTGVDAAVQQVVERAAAAYLRVLAERNRVTANDQDVVAVEAEVDRARKLFTAGKTAQLAVLRAQAVAQRAVAERSATQADLEVAEHELALVTGLSYAAIQGARLVPQRLADTTFAVDTGDGARAGLVVRALASNPDAKIAERRAEVARAVATAVRASAFPQIQASGAYLGPGSINGNFHPDWQLGVAVSYSAFNGGATSNAIQGAEADVRSSREAIRLAGLDAEAAVDQALASLRAAHARVAALVSAEAQSSEVVRIEALARDVGEGIQTDYLAAAADLLRTRMMLIDASHAELMARIELAAITGELSVDWLTRNVEPAS